MVIEQLVAASQGTASSINCQRAVVQARQLYIQLANKCRDIGAAEVVLTGNWRQDKPSTRGKPVCRERQTITHA